MLLRGEKFVFAPFKVIIKSKPCALKHGFQFFQPMNFSRSYFFGQKTLSRCHHLLQHLSLEYTSLYPHLNGLFIWNLGVPCSCSHICTTILPSSFVSYFAFTHFWFQSTDESTPYNISSGLGYHTALAWQEANKNSNILMQIYSGFKWTIKSRGLGWKCSDLLSLHCSTL